MRKTFLIFFPGALFHHGTSPSRHRWLPMISGDVRLVSRRVRSSMAEQPRMLSGLVANGSGAE
jgi:hypothetical protein